MTTVVAASDTLILINLHGQEVDCRVHSTEEQSAGCDMAFMVDMSDAVLFDPQTGY